LQAHKRLEAVRQIFSLDTDVIVLDVDHVVAGLSARRTSTRGMALRL
jgi:hypothetical protein